MAYPASREPLNSPHRWRRVNGRVKAGGTGGVELTDARAAVHRAGPVWPGGHPQADQLRVGCRAARGAGANVGRQIWAGALARFEAGRLMMTSSSGEAHFSSQADGVPTRPGRFVRVGDIDP